MHVNEAYYIMYGNHGNHGTLCMVTMVTMVQWPSNNNKLNAITSKTIEYNGYLVTVSFQLLPHCHPYELFTVSTTLTPVS